MISNVKEGGAPIGNLGDGEAVWHCDMTYVDAPPRAAMLHALEIPPSGGDTFWSNMYLAYETLPPATRDRIAGLRAVHDATYNSAGMMRKGMQEVTDPRRRRARAIRSLSATPIPAGRRCSSVGAATAGSSA